MLSLPSVKPALATLVMTGLLLAPAASASKPAPQPLGPPPVAADCLFEHPKSGCYYHVRATNFDFNRRIVHVGEHLVASGISTVWQEWTFPGDGPGLKLIGCRGKPFGGSATCTWKAVSATNGWSTAVGLTISVPGSNVYVAADYYAVLEHDYGIEGTIRGTRPDPANPEATVTGGVPDVPVTIHGHTSSGHALLEHTRTDEQGNYYVVVHKGSYRVSAPGYCVVGGAKCKSSKTVHAPSGGRVDFRDTSHVASGVVNETTCDTAGCHDGAPTNGAEVVAKAGGKTRTGRTDAQGRYAIAGLNRGTWKVSVKHKKGQAPFAPATRSVTVGPDREGVDFSRCGRDGCPPVYAWAMPARFEKTDDPATTDPAVFDPKTWPVAFKVRDGACDRNATYTWTVDGTPIDAKRKSAASCDFTLDFPKEGRFTVKVTARHPGGRPYDHTDTVTVQDFLIASLGDSAASGEGIGPWTNAQCHRRTTAFGRLSAKAIEEADDHSSVTFVHLACSGATIGSGLLGPYAGIEPGKGGILPGQVGELARLTGSREIDALHVSVGINDAHFGDIIKYCVYYVSCWSKPFDEDSPPKTVSPHAAHMVHRVAQLIHGLSGGYAALASGLTAAFPALNPAHVYLTEYPDPLRKADGHTFCPTLINVRGLPGTGDGRFRGKEVSDGYTHFLVPLRNAGASAAGAHGWHYVEGAGELFRPHGYCRGQTSSRWMVVIREALLNLKTPGNEGGAMHPNVEGHRQWADKVLEPAMEADLLPGGVARAPGG